MHAQSFQEGKWPSRLGLQNIPTAEALDSPNECPRYYAKQSDGEAAVMLELWGMRCMSLLPSHPNPICPGVIATERDQSKGCFFKLKLGTNAKLNYLKMGQIELNSQLMLNWLKWHERTSLRISSLLPCSTQYVFFSRIILWDIRQVTKD